MKRIMSGIYAFVYRLTGAKYVALVFGLTYITILNLITVYGLSQLLQGVAPPPIVTIIGKMFKFPLIILTVPGMFFLNYTLISPIKDLEKDKRNQDNYWPVIIYTLVSFFILAYILYGDELFKVGN